MSWNQAKTYIKERFDGAYPTSKIGSEIFFLWQGLEWIYDIDTGTLIRL